MNEIHLCEVCGNRNLEPVLNLGKHPLCDDLVPIGDTRICSEYPIEILFCNHCKTAHQRYQVPKQVLFPKNYHYRARFTKDVLKGMSGLVDTLEQYLGSLKDKLILDVGCNDGSLLDFFQKKGAQTVGIEPTDAYADGLNRGHHMINGFFSLETAREIKKIHGTFDVITFTNVFAHIENLPELIEALKILMTPSTLVVIENHYLGSVLQLNQFDTFYHEHPRTYSLSSFLHIAKSLNVELKSVEFPSRYGGNIRVMMGGLQEANTQELNSVLEKENQFAPQFKKIGPWISNWKREFLAKLNQWVKLHGKIPAKAFPGRAAILIKLLGIDESLIDCVYEKPGSLKIGHYLPGTRIPIESDDRLFLRNDIKMILNLAWHIPKEIESYLRQNQFSSNIIHIIDP